jgi:hypothetical protein
VEQRSARLVVNQEIVGSNPTGDATQKPQSIFFFHFPFSISHSLSHSSGEASEWRMGNEECKTQRWSQTARRLPAKQLKRVRLPPAFSMKFEECETVTVDFAHLH